jgi:diguanylate cyclase (GGDEF)-like protein
LLVEDDPDLLGFLAGVLSASFSVEQAVNGQTALRVAHQTVPDLIITDLMMPGMSGLELCRKLAADPATAQIPVIVISARGELDDRMQAFSEGAVDFLAKPFHPDELLVRALTRMREKTRSDTLLEQAQRDPLTGLLNRRGVALDPNLDTGLAVFDLDDFKVLNDEQGHSAGDAALVKVANVLLKGVRGSDIVCRWGGDEFLLAMPGITEPIGRRRAHHLAQQLADCGVPATVGYAWSAAGEFSVDELFTAADQRLLEGKARRDRDGSEPV